MMAITDKCILYFLKNPYNYFLEVFKYDKTIDEDNYEKTDKDALKKIIYA